MTSRRRPPLYVLAPGILGLILVAVAFVVETAMGSSNGHRYLAIHIVQLVGAALIASFATLVLLYVGRTKKSR